MSLINQSGRFFNTRFRQTISVIRQDEKLSLTAIIMPSSSNDIALLDESERYLPSVKIYTLEPLERGDKVLHNRTVYVVKSVAQWGDYGYYNQIAVRHIPTAKGSSKGFEIT